MSKSETYVKRTEAFLEGLQKKLKFEIVDVEFVKEGSENYLRVYCDMDKEGGISIDDCADISRALSDWLDEEDFISESYILEVSSPGLGRTLKKERDFIREKGKEVELKLFKPRGKQKEFCGILKEADKESICIEINDEMVRFDRSEISIIRLKIDF
ncbi:MAG: ribosome maturation factor RimP [Johnsonella sp.]|nr:ribosome maturation factor RimP [Johnsonella sp.]